MADITTDVLIIGTGPAGSATAALLASYGVETLVVNRYRWLANTPRAHAVLSQTTAQRRPTDRSRRAGLLRRDADVQQGERTPL